MSLTPGSRIGSFEIQGLLGEGGMGQVYKAHDSRLGRDVAIKVLPPSVANDPERLARFEREAKVLASLSHTNIAQIYGLEDGGASGRVLVMELAPGEDLSVILERRRQSAPAAVAPSESASRGATASGDRPPQAMDIADALPIALQITHALEAAHERAIVHRDLKPANIKVSDDGAVKVLDFGLAKAFSPGDPASASAMNSPTLTAQATAAGVILGTAAYMSPEQARGREADKRADVWAFGVVFFEMLTGARLFQGETISDTLAAVLRQDIPWSALPSGTAAEIRRLLRRCLERDRKNRLHDIADARIVLEEVARGGGKEEAAATVPASVRRTPWLLIAASAVAALGIGVVIGRWISNSPPPAASSGTVRLVIPVPRGVRTVGDPFVSPDGSFIVFDGESGSGGRNVYIQRLNESAPRLVDRTEGGQYPFVSWDNRWIVFRRSNRLEKISIDGGESLPITEIPASSPGSISLPNNTIVFATSWLDGLSSVSADSGPVKKVSTLDVARGEIGHWFPNALPDGRHLLMNVWKKGAGLNDAEVAVLDLDTGRHQILFKGAEPRYMAPGLLVFFRAGSYHAIRFDPVSLRTSGDPVRVIDDAFGNSPEGDVTQTALSANGTLAYLSGPYIHVRELTWIASGGKSEALRHAARAYEGASIAPDGHRLAASAVEGGRHVIHLLNLDRPGDDVLDLPGSSWQPMWHPDGKRLAYRSMQKGDFDTYWKDVTSTNPPESVLVTDADDSPEAFTSDGRLIVEQSNSKGQYLLKLMSIAPPGEPKTLVPFSADRPKVSPDGKMVAFVASRSGSLEAYVQPLAEGARAERVTNTGAQAVAWTRDGRELLYLHEPEIRAVSFRIEGGQFRATGERLWSRIEGSYHENIFATGPDGRVLVAIAKDQPPREIRVIVNWQDEIAKKMK